MTKASKTVPAAVEGTLSLLGQNIRTARLRRKMRLEDVADRVGASRYVISDIEKGKPTTTIASTLSVLWVLGLLEGMRQVADPDLDAEGKILERSRSPKTAAKRKKELDNDF